MRRQSASAAQPPLQGVKPAGGVRRAVVTIDASLVGLQVRLEAHLKGSPVSDLNIALVHAGEREERQVTTGTKAWEPFQDDDKVIAGKR